MTRPRISIRESNKEIYLADTEIVFLRLCCQDLSYKQVAKRMGKSHRTVDGYRDELFKKLQVRSKVGLVLWAIKSGVVKNKDITLSKRSKKKPR